MKCVECEFYIRPYPEDREEAGCLNDGDVANPKEDINCAAVGDDELEG